MEYLGVELVGAVAVVTIDKPPVNTLDYPLYEELNQLVGEVEDNKQARAVLFQTAHPRIFIAGADLKDMAGYDRRPEPIGQKADTVQSTFRRIETMSKPTVAAITGHALGGGCEFSLCLDFRIMQAGGPTIGQPEVNLGIVPGGGGTQRLPRLIGRTQALELLLTGRRLSAEDAYRVGLVTETGRDFEETRSKALGLATNLAGQAPEAVRLIKNAVSAGLDGTLDEGLAIERDAVIEVMQTNDAIEGVAAFLEKRKPDWRGT